jgi:hypothetical protein
MFTALNTGQEAALYALLAQYSAGEISTTTTIAGMVAQVSGNFTSGGGANEVVISSGIGEFARRAQLSKYILTTATASTDWTTLTEQGLWYDGDLIICWPSVGKTINLTAFGVTVRMSQIGHFAMLARVNGQWTVVASNPANGSFPLSGNPSAIVLDSAVTSLVPDSSMVILSAQTGAVPASAVLEVTAATGLTGQLIVFVDNNQVGFFAYTNGSTIDNVGTGVEISFDPSGPFSATYDPITNELTTTDARNLGSQGNSFVLQYYASGGVTASITSNFAGGADGVAANITIDTVAIAALGRTIFVQNGMAANTVTFAVGGNLEGNATLVLASKEVAQLSSFDGTNWAVK